MKCGQLLLATSLQKFKSRFSSRDPWEHVKSDMTDMCKFAHRGMIIATMVCKLWLMTRDYNCVNEIKIVAQYLCLSLVGVYLKCKFDKAETTLYN